MISIKFIVHYSLHFIVPFLFAFVFFRKKWKTVYIIFILSMLVDLDHLLANPIFQENRCSINFHPLHTFWAMAIYILGLFFNKTRILCIALLFHMFTDYLDCLL